jgi:Coenzyme PQQ synthesis protein D (PqqD)
MAHVLKFEGPVSPFSAETAAINASPDPSADDRDDRLFRVLGPADGAAFFLLGDRCAIFSERTQQIYALNQTAAYIWCRLEEQAAPAMICEELAAFGIGADLAQAHIRAAMHSWLKLRLLKVDYSFDIGSLPIERSLDLSIAGFDFSIHVLDQRLAGLLSAFEHHLVPAREADHVFQVLELNGLVHVLHNGHNVICCDDIELMPSIKAYITDRIVTMSPPNIVFHAACLVRGGKSLLISGRPGAGKTTLTLHLTDGEFAYGGDDIVLIAPDGSATGVPFAPAIKPGAWEIVKQFRPDLDDAIIHRRPDGRRVRYLKPTHAACAGRYPVGWIIFIKRTSGPAKLEPLEPVEAMRRLMEGSYSPGEQLNLAACRAINRTLASAGSYELTYSNLAEANEIIERLCNG